MFSSVEPLPTRDACGEADAKEDRFGPRDLEAADRDRDHARQSLRLGSAAAAARRASRSSVSGRGCARRTSTTRAPAARRRPDGGPRDSRTADGSYNDLGQPAMGMIGARFGRNIPIERTFPEELPGLLEPEPTPRQPQAAHARRVHARHDRERPRRRLAPVRSPRLVQSRQEPARRAVRARARRRRPVGRPADADRAHAHRPVPGHERRADDLGDAPTRTGGTDRRSTAASRRSRARSARVRAAGCGSIRTASCRATSTRRST